MKTTRTPTRLRTWAFWLFAAVILLWPFPYQKSLNNPNELVRVYTTMALVEGNGFAIDSYFARFGATMDVAVVPNKAGAPQTYSVKGPGTSYLGVPVYALYRAIGKSRFPAADAPAALHEAHLRKVIWLLRFTTVQIPALIFLFFFERFLRRFCKDDVIRFAVVAGLGFGTNYLAYALMFVSHTQFALAAFTAFALLFNERARQIDGQPARLSRLLLAGLAAGACTTFEYQGAIFTAGMSALAALVVFRSWRTILPLGIPFAVGVLANVASIMYFQAKCFGSPWTPGHKMSANAASAAGHAKGLYGIQAPHLDALGALTTDLGFGLLGCSPLLAVGIFGLCLGTTSHQSSQPARQRQQVSLVIALGTSLLFTLVLSGMEGWRGGWTIGARYLSPIPPFLALGAAIWLGELASQSDRFRAASRALAVGLAGAGMVSLGVVATLYNTLPEDVSRPFSQVVMPMLRGHFVPYSLAHLVGWTNFNGYALVLVAFVGLMVVLMWPAKNDHGYLRRLGLTMLVFSLASTPYLLDPNVPNARRAKAFLFRSGGFEPATGDDVVTKTVKIIDDRVKKGGPGPTKVEALRVCQLLFDQAQESATADWCQRAKSLGATEDDMPR